MLNIMTECFYFHNYASCKSNKKMKHELLSVTVKGSHGNASNQSSHKCV